MLVSMGAFNRYLRNEQCPGCGQEIERGFQFKFGHKWQIDYHAGDTLQWGGNDEGDPGLPSVRVFGVPESCPHCGFDYAWDDSHGFLIRIEDDRLIDVEGPMDFAFALYGSSNGLSETVTALSETAELGPMSDWVYDGELSAEVDTVFGEIIWVTTSTTLARPQWSGPICVSISHTARSNELQEMLTGIGLRLLELDRRG